MKNLKHKLLSGLLVAVLVMQSQVAKAGLADQFNKYIGSEFTSFQGFYIILGVLVAGVIGKLFHYFFIKEDNSKPVSNVRLSHHRHHRHRPVVKKTS